MIRIACLLLLPATLAIAGSRQFGAPMPAGEAVPLRAALEAGAGDAPVKLTGRITEVCQKEGCWLVLADGDHFARVKMAGHAFFVPKDASGAAAVFGMLEEIDVPAAEAAHLREDGATAPAAREFRIEATSVELLD